MKKAQESLVQDKKHFQKAVVVTGAFRNVVCLKNKKDVGFIHMEGDNIPNGRDIQGKAVETIFRLLVFIQKVIQKGEIRSLIQEAHLVSVTLVLLVLSQNEKEVFSQVA